MTGGSTGPLAHVRVCDLSGQLAGAGATRILAAFGADVIRVEDPTNEGRWDLVRGVAPFVDERRGVDLGGAFNNHNVGKRGITLDLRSARGKELFEALVARCDVVTENFSAGTLARLGYPYEALRAIRPDVVYVSNSGFGQTGPYAGFRAWGPIMQAVCGLTHTSGLAGRPPAGWGFSYMDHQGAYFMAVAVLAALAERDRTGRGQHVDVATMEIGAALLGPELLECLVTGAASAPVDSNRSRFPVMVPHGIYPARGDDEWIAIACRSDDEWAGLAAAMPGPLAADVGLAALSGRVADEARIDAELAAWTRGHDKFDLASSLQSIGIAAAAVQRPDERIDGDPSTADWGLWPTVSHPLLGSVRVEGLPVHLSETDWRIDRPAPCLGEHNEEVLTEVLDLSEAEVDELRRTGVI